MTWLLALAIAASAFVAGFAMGAEWLAKNGDKPCPKWLLWLIRK